MHKQPTVVLLVLISVLCITACSSSAPATSDTSVPTMTTLRVWSQHDLTDQSRTTSVLMQQRVADFEAATGISVEYEQIAWDQLAPKLALAVQSGGVVPDVVETGRQHIPTLFAVGALAALDEVLAAETWVTELDERDSQSCIIDGRRYCVANLVRGGITYYRTSAFPDGFPETHSAWLEAGERLQAEGMYLSTFFAGRSYASIEWAWAPWIYSNGGRIFDEQGRPAWATPEVAEVLAYARTLLARGYLPAEIITGDIPTGELPWIEGEAASFRGGTWSFLYVPDLRQGIETGTVQITGGLRFNDGPAHVFLNNESWIVPTGARNPAAAAAWISGLMQPDFLAAWSKAQFGIPTHPAARALPDFDTPFYQQIMTILLEQGRYMDRSPYYVESMDILAIAVQEILLNPELDIQQRLQAAEAEILQRYW